MKIILLSLLSTLFLFANDVKNTRFFGGLSENEVNLVKSEKYATPKIKTEKIFEAKKPEDIETEVIKKKVKESKKGKFAKAFAKETDGHLFGGLSQNPVNLK